MLVEWKAPRQHVEFMFKGPLRAKNEEERCCYLMLWVGEKGRRIFSTWNMTAEQKKVLQEYYDRFQAYVQPRSNPVFARHRLHSMISFVFCVNVFLLKISDVCRFVNF